ncbi:lipase family alpha/beta hydrolase [Micropruina sp.]|uniref:lipase family alpha/beta hydrolase n=1 Tax=Micropruina sp. TaxID=2737536 RepID=UPI0039E5A99C
MEPADPSRVVWDAGFPDVGNLLVRPGLRSVDRYPELRPMGLIKSKKLFGIWTKIPGYEALLQRLAALPDVILDDGTTPTPRLDANVVAIGYDFRIGVAKGAEYLHAQLMPRLEALWPKPDDRRGRIIFVAHSMGGLVARHWLAQDGHTELCRELITLGTPHRGAPKALDILANGIPVLGAHLIKGPVRRLLRSWQGVYDLLPTEAEVHDRVSDRWLTVQALPLAWNQGMATAAGELHRSLTSAWSALPAEIRPSVQPRIGVGHGTQRACSWDGKRVRVTKDAPARPGLGKWAIELGDGTVPMLSGLPPEMIQPPTGLSAAMRHGQIIDLPEVIDRLQDAENYPVVHPIEGVGVKLSLGVDLEELSLTGQPTPLAATVRGADMAGNPGRCVATAITDDGTGRSAVELSWDSADGRFVGELPALFAGGYQVRVDWEAEDLLHSEASLEVLNPELVIA